METPRTFRWKTRVRSYELDSFGHVNHAVHLNWFEQARFEALEAGGFPPSRLAEEGWGVHVVRIEVDYRREVRLGDRIRILTRVVALRNSSFSLEQRAYRPDPGADGEGALVAEGKVVVVWVGSDGAPMRVPPEVRLALGGG
jgi:YbgC/YbaW family acyl-CoA thioester hydrolase